MAAAPEPVPTPASGIATGGAPGGTLVEVRDLVKHFPIHGGVLQRTVATVGMPSRW